MTKRELIHAEILALCKEGGELALDFKNELGSEFHFDYQFWYTKSLKAIESLAPDRYKEFRNYYEIDPKRKYINNETFVIQDFIKFTPTSQIPDFNAKQRVLICFMNQLTILRSIETRIDSVIANIEGELYAELKDGELVIARQLVKINHRAAGALVGVVIEGHLQKVAISHNIKVTKKNPTIADLNEPLKSAGVIDMPEWRKISFLADLRNLCSHKKDSEPTKEQVEELIQGADWLTKNIF
jgi:hypothetical protein